MPETVDMVETIQADIITQLETIEGVLSVAAWQGDIQDLIKTPMKLPALRVIYQSALFDEIRTGGAGAQPTVTLTYLIVLLGKNLQSRQAGASACYPIMDEIRKLLIGHDVVGYDFLWPKGEDLLFAEGGLLAYGLTYSMQTIWKNDE
jgi:hypothetical protein